MSADIGHVLVRLFFSQTKYEIQVIRQSQQKEIFVKITPQQALMTCYWYLNVWWRENDEIQKNLKNFDIQILI